MSPQHSNREALIEGTLRCLERLPPERVTARAIAAESGANLGSIVYHFGSKEALVTEAVVAGLDRWLAETETKLGSVSADSPAARLRQAAAAIEGSRARHLGLARNFLTALSRAQHDPGVRERLARGFRDTRPAIAALLDLGTDRPGEDAAGLIHAMFVGLLFQTLLDPSLAIEGRRLERAQTRLRGALADEPR